MARHLTRTQIVDDVAAGRDEFLSAAALGKRFGVGRDTIKELERAGKLTPFRHHQRTTYSLNEYKRHLAHGAA